MKCDRYTAQKFFNVGALPARYSGQLYGTLVLVNHRSEACRPQNLVIPDRRRKVMLRPINYYCEIEEG